MTPFQKRLLICFASADSVISDLCQDVGSRRNPGTIKSSSSNQPQILLDIGFPQRTPQRSGLCSTKETNQSTWRLIHASVMRSPHKNSICSSILRAKCDIKEPVSASQYFDIVAPLCYFFTLFRPVSILIIAFESLRTVFTSSRSQILFRKAIIGIHLDKSKPQVIGALNLRLYYWTKI